MDCSVRFYGDNTSKNVLTLRVARRTRRKMEGWKKGMEGWKKGRLEALPVLDILEKPSFAEKTRFLPFIF